MNYLLHYDRLLERYGSWEKPRDTYVERHRKFPGYLGGAYVEGNAFYVSARVHYLAHILWAKITEDEEAWLTVRLMRSVESGKTSKLYEIAKLKSLPKLRNYLSKARKISGDNAFANKTGIYAATKQQRVEWSRQAGLKTVLVKRGVHSADSNTLSEWGKKAGDAKYQCLGCNLITTCGALGKHQKSSGHLGREKVHG